MAVGVDGPAERFFDVNGVRLRVLEAGRDIPVDDAMDHLVRLNLNRWDEAGAAFQTEEFRTFHRMLARKLASETGAGRARSRNCG